MKDGDNISVLHFKWSGFESQEIVQHGIAPTRYKYFFCGSIDPFIPETKASLK